MISSSFCLSENVFTLSSFWKNHLAGYRITGWQVFSFDPLGTLFRLLTRISSDETSVVILILLHIMHPHSSLATFRSSLDP